MPVKAFLDSNILIYAVGDDSRLTIVNPFVA